MNLPSGFNNTGVVCWFNSLLQSLISCEHFYNHFKDNQDSIENQSHTYNELCTLVNKITKSEDIRPMSVLILKGMLKDYEIKKQKLDIAFGQQSPRDGLMCLLEAANNKELDASFNHVYEVTLICNETKKILSKKRDNGTIINAFDEESLIQKGLENFLLSHQCQLETDFVPDPKEYKDYEHKEGYTYKRTYNLRRIPDITIISLNRYYTDGKQHRPRNPNINLPDEMNFPFISGGNLTYKKVATCEHSGGLNGGHWISRATREDKTYVFNDMSVVPYEGLKTLPSTYLTFYVKA